MVWVFCVSAVGTLPLFFALGRRQEQATHRAWRCALTPRVEKVYEALAQRVEGDLDLAVITYTEAFAVRESGTEEEALRLLGAGHTLVERCAPSMLRLLAGMATFSRVAEVVVPMAPLRPRAFRLRPLAALAAAGRALDHVLVSAGERFRLRVYLLGHGYGLAARYLMRESERMIQRGSWSAADWQRIESIHGDFVTLTEELLRSLKALLASLAAVPNNAAG